MVWKLDDGGTARVFYTDSTKTTPEIVRLSNLNINVDFVYNKFGWDLPRPGYQKVKNKITYDDLYGIKSATVILSSHTINITLDNPKESTFGKRIHK